MTDAPDFVWNSPREQYPADFIAWFEEWRGPLSDYTEAAEGDEDDEDACNYAEARFLAFGGWSAGQASVLNEQS